MKLVLTRDIFNAKQYGVDPDVLKDDDRFRHPNHLHKGFRIEIGKSSSVQEMTKDDVEKAGMLLKFGMAVMETPENKDVIARIDREADEECKAHKESLKPRKSFIEQLSTAIATAVVAAIKGTNGKANPPGAAA